MFQLQFNYKLGITEHKDKRKPTIKLTHLIYLKQPCKPFSDFARKNMSEARKGIIFSETARKNMSEARKGVPFSEAHKLNMSLVRIGKKRGPFSEATRLNMSKASMGKPKSAAHRKALSKARTGRKASEAARLNMSLARRGDKRAPHSEITKLKMSKSHQGVPLSETHKKALSKAQIGKNLGVNSRNWKGGITSLGRWIRLLEEYKQWRKQVFERDHYDCQDCFKQGGYLHAHHIKKWSVILKEFLALYNQFSPIDDKETLVRLAINYAPFWELSNGKTLCKECHKKYRKNIQKDKTCL